MPTRTDEVSRIAKLEYRTHRAMEKSVQEKGKKKLCRNFGMVVLAALVYAIWTARNEAMWNSSIPNPRMICQQVKLECKYRVQGHG